jgi:uncharacterized membrane protein
MDDLTLKWLHILSAIVLVGGGLGSAFHLLAASLQRKPSYAAAAAQNVLRSDAIFTGPSAVFQVASGIWLAHRLGLVLSTPWIAWSLALYAVAMGLWIPVVLLEIRMRRIARDAARRQGELPAQYWLSLVTWAALAAVGFIAFLGVLWLMTAKRFPWW